MQAFMKTVKSATNTKQIALKQTITTQLSETVKDIQLCTVEEGGDLVEAQNSLCSIIEAIFLHGLKDSIAHRFRRALADVDQRPEPNFWAPLLVISHRQIIDQISNLNLIATEIGQCRAWIRLTLNDSLLSSYLMTIQQDPSALKPYYNTFAYVRDMDLLEVAQKYIEGVEAIKLMLPSNSSLLNAWPLPTLLLAGIWSPTLKSCPIASGVDIAQMIPATSSVNSETCSIASLMSQNSGIGQVLALNQDEALKIILAKHSDNKESETVNIPHNNILPPSPPKTPPDTNENTNCDTAVTQPSSFGNSLNRQSGWSFDENHSETPETIESETNDNNKSMEHSYNALVESSYNMFSGTHIRTPDFREVWQRLETSVSQKNHSDTTYNVSKESPPPRNQPLALAAQVTLIAREKGLDYYNYECCDCKKAFSLGGTEYKKPRLENDEIICRVCGFTGEYFCDSCMAAESIAIPARIIHNWDFKKYSVSQKAFNCLQEIKTDPLIDFKTANPYIYHEVEEMAKLQTLRNQLNYLRAYLYTCREPIIEELQKHMYPREYMYEHIHQYSISDLLEIKDETLAHQLEKVVVFGTNHVLNCWLCSQKGFLCEICNQSKAVFPFDTDNVYRCNLCSGVYHKSCLNAKIPCSRCKRKKMRDDLPLLDATLD